MPPLTGVGGTARSTGMKTPFASLLLLALAACASAPPKTASFPEAQNIVNQTMAKNTKLAHLTIHGVAAGDTRSRVIASSASARLGTWSDPEDTGAIESGQPVTLKEGDNLEYTAPIRDASGRTIGAVGVTIKGGAGTPADIVLAWAKEVALEVSAAVAAAGKPLW
jgi:hypothetical protein